MKRRFWSLVTLLVLTACGQGGEAPTVQLGALPTTVTAGGELNLNAQASAGVVKVAFFDGAVSLGEDTSAPYALTITLTAAQNGLHHYSAQATNAAGLVGRSATGDVTVNIAGGASADAAELYRTQGVTVTLPDAFKGQALTAGGLLSEGPLSGTAFTQTVLGGTSPLLHVNSAAGTPLLLGWLNPAGETVLDARSSAAAMIYYALGMTAIPDPDQRAQVRAALLSSPTLTPLVQAITAALASGQALDAPGVGATLEGVRSALAAGGLNAQGLLVEPGNEKNGIQPNLGENNSLWFTNSALRPARVVIDREYFVDASGQKVVNFQADALKFDVPPVTKFGGTLSTIATYFALPPDQRGTVGGFLPQDSSHATLPNLPGARKTVYTAYVYAPGALAGAEGQLSTARQDDLADLSFKFFMTDVFFPYMGDLTGSLVGKLADDPETAKTLSAFTTKAVGLVPTLVPLIKAGNYKEALLELTVALGNDGDLQAAFLKLAFQQLLQESKRNNAGGTGGGFDPVNTANTGAAYDKFKQLTGALQSLKSIQGGLAVVDKVLKGANLLALTLSVALNERAHVLTLTANDVKVFLTTDLQTPEVTHPAHLTAKIEGQDEAGNTDGLTIYNWTLGGAAGIGELQLANGGLVLHPGDTLESGSSTATFVSFGIDGQVPVQVEVLRKNGGGSQKNLLGKDSLTLNVSNLLVSVKPQKSDSVLPGVCPPSKYASYTVLPFTVSNDGSLPVKYVASGATFASASSGTLAARAQATVSVRVPIPGSASASVVFSNDGGSTGQGSSRTLGWSGSVTLGPPPSKCGPDGPDGPSGPGSASGDPHLRSYDGSSYDFQGVGDYVMTQGRGADAQDWEVQSRFQKLGDSSGVSVAVGLAVQVLGDKVEVLRVGSALQTRVNGTLLSGDSSQKLPNGGGLSASAQKVTVAHPDGSWISLDSGYTVQGQLAGARRGKVWGLLGSFDDDPGNDLQVKNGAVLSGPGSVLYKDFRSSWNVRLYSPGSLFTQGPDLWDAFFPAGVVSLNDLDPARRAAAENICLSRGILTQEVLDGCTYDVAITGDASFADYAFGVDPNVPRILVNPALALVETGTNRNFGAYVTGLSDRRVSWTATGGTITGDALATYTAPATPGNYILTATSVVRPDLSGAARALVFQSGRLVWTGAGDGVRWADPKNWSGNVLPGERDVVSINAPGVTVVRNSGDDKILRLEAQTPLKIESGNLAVSGDAALSTLTLTGGSFRVGGAAKIGTVTQSDGSVVLDGQSTVTSFTETGGSLTLTEKAVASIADLNYSGYINNLGTLTLTGQGTWTRGGLQGSGRTINTGTLSATPGASSIEGNFENRGTLRLSVPLSVSAGRTFLNAGTLELIGTGGLCCDAVLTNTGRLVKTGAADSVVRSVVNTGSVEVQGGTLDLQSGTLNGGSYTTAAGTALHLGTLGVNGALSGLQTGRLYLDFSTLTVGAGQEAHLNFTGRGLELGFSGVTGAGQLVNDSGGLLTVVGVPHDYAGFSVGEAATFENAGTLRLQENMGGVKSGTFINSGTLDVQGNASLGGELKVLNTGIILKSGNGGSSVNAVFTNRGGMKVTGGTLTLGQGLLDGGSYDVAQGATLRVLNVSAQGTLSGAPAGLLWVDYGSLTVPAGQEAHLKFGGTGWQFGFSSVRGPGRLVNDAGGLARAVVGSNLSGSAFSQGAVVENAGLWQFSENAGSDAGTSFLNSGTLELTRNVGLSGELALTNTGTLLRSGTDGGYATLDVPFTNRGRVQVTNGTLTLDRGLLSGGQYATAAGTTLALRNLTLEGTLSGQQDGSLYADAGTLSVPAETHLALTGTGFTLGNPVLVGPGTLYNDAPGMLSVVNRGDFSGVTVKGGLTLSNAGTFRVGWSLNPSEAGTSLFNTGRLEFTTDQGINGGTMKVRNSGLMVKTGGTGFTTLDADVTSTGTITPTPTSPPTAPGFSFPRGLR